LKKKVIPIKIAHISDIHQGLGYPGPSPSSRFEDINRILDWTADRLIAEKVDLCLVAGDMFKDAKVMLDRASQEIASIVRFLRQLTEAGIEIVVISGTPSHDSIAAYEIMKEMKLDIEGNCRIFTQPGMTDYWADDENSVSIACLPGLNRSALLTQDEYKGLPPEQVHRIMTDKITQLCMGMSAQMPDDKPKILMAHMTYQGAETGFTDLLMQNEPILTREAVEGFDLVCLGHIHKPQIIDDKVFYSGPVERLSFNEEGINPGFWIHEVESNLPFDRLLPSRLIETPARRYITLDLINYLACDHCVLDVKDAIVRLHYSCSQEFAELLSRKQLEQSLYDAGAFYISEIKADIERVDRARDSEVTESLTPLMALGKWCENQGIDAEESKALQAMSAELLENI
jgi:exonuclease SbcD